MSRAYIPRADRDALAWLQGFVGALSQSPAAYMVGQPDLDTLQRAVNEYAAALAAASSEQSRTKPVVLLKDQTRHSAEQVCRLYAMLIKQNAGIDDASKIAAGIRPLNRGRQRIACPATSPLVNVIAATPHAHTLRYRDSMTPESSAKPFGAVGLELFIAVGDEPVKDPKEARLYGRFTKNPMTVKFDAVDDGRVASYFGRWTSQRGDVGPWSAPVSFRIAA
jgi:hypothetical protein